jgi:hypothetical protein
VRAYQGYRGKRAEQLIEEPIDDARDVVSGHGIGVPVFGIIEYLFSTSLSTGFRQL